MKFLNFSASFVCNIILVILLISLGSCSSNAVDSNKNFQEKYSANIAKIKAERVEPKSAQSSDTKLNFTSPIDQDFSRYTNDNTQKFPEFYSTQQFANQPVAPSGFRMPAEMFENNYNPTIASPFRKIGVEFDAINIPNQDAYGIKSEMSKKEYLLMSRGLLQKNVDQINAQKSADDIKNSEELIAEQRKLKRKIKMIKIFGHESVTVEDDMQNNSKGKFGEGGVKKKDDKPKSNQAKIDSDKNKIANKTRAGALPAPSINIPAGSSASALPAAIPTPPKN